MSNVQRIIKGKHKDKEHLEFHFNTECWGKVRT